MATLIRIAEYDHLLDGMALAACLVLIVLVALHRLQYGARRANRRCRRPGEGVTNAIARQTMSQRSRQAYDNLQRLLAREFEALQTLSGDDGEWGAPAASFGSANHRQRYRQAREMLNHGDAESQILQRCGLAACELSLLRNLAQFADKPHADQQG